MFYFSLNCGVNELGIVFIGIVMSLINFGCCSGEVRNKLNFEWFYMVLVMVMI